MAIVVENHIVHTIINPECISERIMYMKIKAQPADILLIQVCMLTSQHEDFEIEECYEAIENIMHREGSGKVNTILMGDWNSVVGSGREANIVGSHGLGKRNYRGTMLIKYCQKNDLVIPNTLFKKPNKGLYTWIKPGGEEKYQI